MGIRSVFDGGELRREFEKNGIDGKFVGIIWKHVIGNNAKGESGEWNWEKQVPSLPSSAYSVLRSNFGGTNPLSSSLHSVFHSSDNLTSKLLLKLHVLYSQPFFQSIATHSESIHYLIFLFCRTGNSWRL